MKINIPADSIGSITPEQLHELEKPFEMESYSDLLAGVEKENAERAKEFHNYLDKVSEPSKAQKELNEVMKRKGKQIPEENQRAFEAEAEEEARKAKERVMKEYEKQGKIESDTKKALRNIIRNMNKS